MTVGLGRRPGPAPASAPGRSPRRRLLVAALVGVLGAPVVACRSGPGPPGVVAPVGAPTSASQPTPTPRPSPVARATAPSPGEPSPFPKATAILLPTPAAAPVAAAPVTASATPTARPAPPSPSATPTRPTEPARPTTPPPTPGAAAVPVAAEEVARGDPTRPWVSLVFNAGAGYEPAPSILDTLRAKGVRTTFFLMGWWAEKEPALVRRIAAEGHEVASHGYKVFDLTAVSDAEVVADLSRAEAAISALTGRTTKPLWSPSAGYRDARVRRLAASLGYRPIYWTVDSGDWREDATAEAVRRRVLDGAANGAIIVMHFESPRTADTVAPALPGIVDGLRAKGYRLVTVTELLTGQLLGAR